jgi:EmrB/QacA subfamily drug resistance transporter
MAATDVHRRWTLILCCLAQFMVVLDVAIVNVALPSIRSDLGFSGANLQWVVSAYTLSFAGFLLLGGRAADLLGRRRVFVFGLGLFALASLAGGLAPSQGVLVAARAAQGLGGAIVAPASLSILSTTFAEGAERNRALGAWAAMGAIGGAMGSVLGGILTETLNWRWILFINLPIGIAGALAALRHISPDRPTERRPDREFDLAGALSVTLGLVVLVYGIVGTERHGWTSTQTLLNLAAGIALLAAFAWNEGRRAKAPLVPLRIFRSRQLVGANVVVFALGSSAFAMWYFASLYMQEVLGYSPIKAGMAFLPMPVTIAIFSTISGRVTLRIGPGRMLLLGMSCIGVGMLLFARVAVHGTYLADILVPSIITAAGIGLSFAPATIAAVAGARPEEQGLASGLVNTSRQVGGSLGLAVLATLATQRTAHLRHGGHDLAALTAGFHRAFLVGGCFALLGALAAATLLSNARVPRGAVAAADADSA